MGSLRNKLARFDTLTGRMVVVIATALLVSHSVMFVAMQTHLDRIIARTLHHAQSAYAAAALRQVRALTPDQRALKTIPFNSAVLGVWISDEPFFVPGAARDADLEARLRRSAGFEPERELWAWLTGVDLLVEQYLPGPMEKPARQGHYGLLHCAVEVRPGEWVNIAVRPQPRFWPPSPPIAVFLTTSLLAVALAAALVARRVARPFRAFTQAAERLTAGEEHKPVRVYGPVDLRRAQSAFNVMGARLHATLSSQKALLAAIGHDLRTPLTSLRVRVELLADEHDRRRMARALNELQRLTEAALRAASAGDAGDPIEAIDLVGLVSAVCDDVADLGLPVAFEEPAQRPIVRGWPEELGRAVRNVVENAVRYGERADVRLQVDGAECAIIIADQGPGIPEADQERVFDPLVRLEGSRNAATGGHGLGLHIARNTVLALGGDIRVRNRPDGGLEATIQLPLSAPA